MDEYELELDAELSFSASTPAPDTDDSLDFESDEFQEQAGTGFNDYGVRENRTEDGQLKSVDVAFEAMQPGPPERRNGVRITREFLKRVANKDYRNQPLHLKNHDGKDVFSDIGRVKNVWFSNQAEKLALVVNVPNTGGPTHDEAIARYTFEPPAIRNGSVGFGNQYRAVRNADGEPELADGKMREFSAVNFPGGYDSGGIASAFADEATEAVANFDDEEEAPSSDSNSDDDTSENSATDDKQDFSVTTETITF